MAKNNEVYELSAIDTVPRSVAKTGTIVSAGVDVTGTGTLFSNPREINIGDWI